MSIDALIYILPREIFTRQLTPIKLFYFPTVLGQTRYFKKFPRSNHEIVELKNRQNIVETPVYNTLINRYNTLNLKPSE